MMVETAGRPKGVATYCLHPFGLILRGCVQEFDLSACYPTDGGFPLLEVLRLRVKDVNFARHQLFRRDP